MATKADELLKSLGFLEFQDFEDISLVSHNPKTRSSSSHARTSSPGVLVPWQFRKPG